MSRRCDMSRDSSSANFLPIPGWPTASRHEPDRNWRRPHLPHLRHLRLCIFILMGPATSAWLFECDAQPEVGAGFSGFGSGDVERQAEDRQMQIDAAAVRALVMLLVHRLAEAKAVPASTNALTPKRPIDSGDVIGILSSTDPVETLSLAL